MGKRARMSVDHLLIAGLSSLALDLMPLAPLHPVSVDTEPSQDHSNEDDGYGEQVHECIHKLAYP